MVDVPFEGYSKRIKTITIGGKELLIKPKVSDAEAYMLMAGNMNEKTVKQITDIFVNMIKRAYVSTDTPVNEEDIKDFIGENYGDFFYESAVLFGFMTKEQMEETKKKAVSSKIGI